MYALKDTFFEKISEDWLSARVEHKNIWYIFYALLFQNLSTVDACGLQFLKLVYNVLPSSVVLVD